MTKQEIENEIEKLIPGLSFGMFMEDALALILLELRRLKLKNTALENLLKGLNIQAIVNGTEGQAAVTKRIHDELEKHQS